MSDQNKFIDALIEKMHLKNDAALAQSLEVAPPIISKIRSGRRPVGPSIIVRICDVTGMSSREVKALMGIIVPPAAELLAARLGRSVQAP